MREAMEETGRRRSIQLAYNERHGVVPRGIVKTREEILRSTSIADSAGKASPAPDLTDLPADPEQAAARIEALMLDAASRLEFESAARLRDELRRILAAAGRTGPARG